DLRAPRFILDGELAIPQGKALSFDALQMRLHPAASRSRRLAAETPAILIVFDLLQAADGRDLASATLSERRQELQRFFAARDLPRSLVLSPATTRRAEASRWLRRAGGGALDGVVAKR